MHYSYFYKQFQRVHSSVLSSFPCKKKGTLECTLVHTATFFIFFFYIKISILRNRKLNASQITAQLDVLDEYPDIPSDSGISGCSDYSFDDESWNPESWQNRGIRLGNSSKKKSGGESRGPPWGLLIGARTPCQGPKVSYCPPPKSKNLPFNLYITPYKIRY